MDFGQKTKHCFHTSGKFHVCVSKFQLSTVDPDRCAGWLGG
jgi:hypothetical protein